MTYSGFLSAISALWVRTCIAALLVVAVARPTGGLTPCQAGDLGPDVHAPYAAKNFPWSDYFIALSRLGNHWMPDFGVDGDSMTETFWSGVTDTYHPFGSAGFQETWLIPRTDEPAGAGGLFRMYSPSLNNHLDSPTSTPPMNYSMEFQEGKAFTSQLAGTKPITRYFKSSITDHQTWLSDATPSGYTLDIAFNTASGTPRYGYQRFGNCLSRNAVLNESCSVGCVNPYQYFLSNSSLRVDFNKVWGNAIGKITYLPAAPAGRQVVTRDDLGSLVQTALFLPTSMDDLEEDGCCRLNPTEAGGLDRVDYSNTLRWVGSPLISATYTGIGQPVQTLTTILKPLNFNHDMKATDTTGSPRTTDVYSPLLWKGSFRRATSLGYTISSNNYTDVVKLRFEAQRDNQFVGLQTDLNVMHTIAFLQLEHPPVDVPTGSCFPGGSPCVNANFLHAPFFELLELETGTVRTGAFPASPGGEITGTSTAADRAVIVTLGASTFSVGMFRKPSVAFPLDNFGYGRAPAPLPAGSKGVALGANVTHGNIAVAPAWSLDDSFLVMGPTSVVETRLRQVYCHQTGNCSPPAQSTTITRRRLARLLVQVRGEEPVNPSTCATPTFADVPCSAADWGWIQRIYTDGLTSGCGGGNFCPDTLVINAQMAVLLTKAKYCPLNKSCPGGTVLAGPYPGWTDIQNNPSDPYYTYLPFINRGYADTAEIYQPGTKVLPGCSASPLKFCPAANTTDADINTYLARYWSN